MVERGALAKERPQAGMPGGLHVWKLPARRSRLSWLSCAGQSMAETAVVLPVLILLFVGCLQLLQTLVAHMVVMEAAYEAGRQAYIQDRLEPGRQAAVDICRKLSQGRTDFAYDAGTGKYRVVHDFEPLFSWLPHPPVAHACPAYLFASGDRGDPDAAP